MDMSFATIPFFGGEFRRLYRETQMAYIISDDENPSNHPIYAEEKELGSSILHIAECDDGFQPELRKKQDLQTVNDEKTTAEQIWKLYFDGASSREGSRAGVVLIPPTQQVVTLSYKLQFQTTNNTTEYEALILGMKAAKDLGADQLTIFGDSELVIRQVRNQY